MRWLQWLLWPCGCRNSGKEWSVTYLSRVAQLVRGGGRIKF